MQQNQDMITIKGTVERITFTNTSNAFTVLELDVAGDDTITVVGELYGVAVGEELKLTGNYTSHPRFGYQFKAELCERTLPSEANAILKYLSGGAIKGIGPITARRLVEKFGDDTLKIIETEPQQLCDVKGITLKSAMKISEEFKKIFGIRKVIAYLSKFNVTAIQAIAVWKKFGADAIELVEENPYLLCSDDIGVSFFDLDAITEDMNIPRESEYRIRAGIMFVMDYNFNGGHTCLPFASLLSKSCELLNLANDVVEIELEAMLSCEYLVEYSNDKNRYVYLPHTYLAERYVSEKLKIMMQNFSSDEYDADKSIDKIEKNMGITFEAMQRTAIKTALNSSVMILTGGPGTGKTTTLRGIIECLKQNGEKVAVAAPTGRAAKRISELTGEDAKTIHRLLEVDFTSESAHISFKRNERNLLDA
ncbi:MAG: AAA family ATPase, partial [Oscillospiraceae bacterium]|nr:AAA family ATPase [Oscillospiraceae bacterium]